MCASRQHQRRPSARLILWCAIAVALAVPVADASERPASTLDGRATNAAGAPLPGTTVTLSGGGANMVQVTDADGRFLFRDLSAGSYTLEFTLDGYGTVTTRVQVFSDAKPSVTVTLTPASDVGGVVVRDGPFESSQRVWWSDADLDRIPAARDPWAVLQQTPGVLIDRINVGGNEAGQQARFGLAGVPPSSGVWSLDGTVITDMAAVGASPAYFDFDTFEEVQITTGGVDASIPYGGAVVKLVTRSGTNDFHGRFSYFNRSGDPGSLSPAPSRNAILDDGRDFGAELGGRIVKDRLWVWGSYGASANDVQRSASDALVDADVDRRQLFGKATWQPSPWHRLIGSYSGVDNDLAGAGAGFGRTASATSDREDLLTVYSGSYSGVFAGVLLEGGVGRSVIKSSERPTDGVPAFRQGSWRNSYLDFDADRPQTHVQGAISTALEMGNVTHELKGGVGYRTYEETSRAAWQSDGFTVLDGQFPVRVLTPVNNWAHEGSATSVYAQDTIFIDKWTFQLGLRYDTESASNLPSQLGANPGASSILPGGRYTGGDVFDTDQASPRLGLSYALGKDRQTLLRASYSRFADQLGTESASFLNPLYGAPGNYAYGFSFDDRNGNLLPDAGEPRGAGLRLGNASGAFTSGNRVAEDLRAPVVDEFTAGLATTLGDWMLGIDVSRRTVTDLIDELPLVSDGGAPRFAGPVDYVLDRTLSGLDFDNDPYSIAAQRLRPGLSQVGLQRQNGDRESEMFGTSLVFSKRLANRWMLRGNAHFNDWTTTADDSGVGDANDLLGPDDNDGAPAAFEGGTGRGGLFLNSQWSFNVNGLYQIVPDRPWGLDLAWDVYGRDGNLAPAWAELRGGDSVTRRLQIGDVDRRLPDLYMINLRVTTRFAIGRSDLGLSFDVLNAAGSDTTLQQDRDTSSATHRAITERLSPRVFRIGARLTFR